MSCRACPPGGLLWCKACGPFRKPNPDRRAISADDYAAFRHRACCEVPSEADGGIDWAKE